MPADHLLGIPFVVFMVRFRLGRVFVAPLPSSGSMGGDQSATFPFHNGDDNPTTVTLLLRCFPKCYYKSHRHLTCLRVAPSIRYSIFYSASRRIRMGIRMTPLGGSYTTTPDDHHAYPNVYLIFMSNLFLSVSSIRTLKCEEGKMKQKTLFPLPLIEH